MGEEPTIVLVILTVYGQWANEQGQYDNGGEARSPCCFGLWLQGGQAWDSVLGGRQLRSSHKSVGCGVIRPGLEPGPATYLATRLTCASVSSSENWTE